MGEAGARAEVDLGGAHLSALVDLKASIDKLHGHFRDLLELEALYQQQGPVFVNLQGSGTVDASADPLYIDLGGPAYGRAWEVRQLVIGGATWATTVSGNAVVFVQGASLSTSTGVGLSSVQDHATSLPSVAFYSAGQFRVRNPNHIYVAIIGGSASTGYQIAGDAFDLPDRASRSVFTG